MLPTRSMFVVLFFSFVCQCVGHMDPPKVTTQHGKFIGTRMVTRYGRNINAFFGIPYAQPPIGPLRFSNPLPVTPSTATYLAKIEPPPCPQIGDNNGAYFGQEDCLFLNVYTPKIDSNNLLPTMVYIHGGAFQRGHIRSTYLGPNFILDKDVVLVTMQYRLGVLGFLSTGDTVAPGNFGLKDQALALRWVQNNIKHFGGDPGNVTLFGQSSGSVSVNFHVLSSVSKGLFHRYIAQSGSALSPWGFINSDSYKHRAYSLGNEFQCPKKTSQDLIDCLRKIRIEDLLISPNSLKTGQQLLPIIWIPTNEPNVKGAFLTEHPLKSILSGKTQDLPNISGSVKDEGLVLTLKLYSNKTYYEGVTKNVSEFLRHMSSSILTKNDSLSLTQNLEDFYFSNVDGNNASEVLHALTNIISDVSFLFPSVLQLQLVTQRIKSHCYYYSFEYRGTFSKTMEHLINNENVGVVHADDLMYLFPTTAEEFRFPNLTASEEDEKMIDIFVDLWTNFAIYGVPKTNYNNNPYMWRPYKRNHYHLRIGDGNKATLTGQTHFLEGRMHFWAMQVIKLLIWSEKFGYFSG